MISQVPVFEAEPQDDSLSEGPEACSIQGPRCYIEQDGEERAIAPVLEVSGTTP